MFEIRVPASSANLGPGFDCFGLALQLYLKVTVEPLAGPGWFITLAGEGAELLPANEQNLIARVATVVAYSERTALPGLRLHIENQIPLSRGLGSSAAAITAGIALYEALAERELAPAQFFHYALQFENHADNISAARFGGFTLACARDDGAYITLKQPWPEAVRALVAIPDAHINTEEARAALPRKYARADAVYNMQHALLLQAALAQGRLDLIGAALNDRFHQPYRAKLAPGLTEALAVRARGLLGVVISGSGPTVLALAHENFDTISTALQQAFSSRGVSARTTLLAIDQQGRSIRRY